jgi:predicted PurR-regulated permease PerM
MPLQKLKSLLVYLLLGGAVSFLVATLLNWIWAEMANPVQMSIFIGLFLAFIFWVIYDRSRRDKA